MIPILPRHRHIAVVSTKPFVLSFQLDIHIPPEGCNHLVGTPSFNMLPLLDWLRHLFDFDHPTLKSHTVYFWSFFKDEEGVFVGILAWNMVGVFEDNHIPRRNPKPQITCPVIIPQNIFIHSGVNYLCGKGL